MVVPLKQPQQLASQKLAGASELGGTSQPGGTSDVGETSGPGRLDESHFAPLTPPWLLGREIPHHRRVTSPVKSADHDGEGERGFVGGEDQPLTNITTVSSNV